MSTLVMPGPYGSMKGYIDSEMYLNVPVQVNRTTQKLSVGFTLQAPTELYCPLIPGLPDDLAKLCLVLVPREDLPVLGAVSMKWRSFIKSKEFLALRKEAGKLEEWVYILTGDADGRDNHWEVLVGPEGSSKVLPPMPGPMKAGFGVAVIDANLLIIAGYSVDLGTECVSDDVYQYDSRLNRY